MNIFKRNPEVPNLEIDENQPRWPIDDVEFYDNDGKPFKDINGSGSYSE